MATNFIWRARPYYRRVAGLLALGGVAGVIMNTSVVLPAVLLGRAIDTATALAQGKSSLHELAGVLALYLAGTALYFAMRMGKRWWLRTAVRRTIANVQNDAFRGVLAWPMQMLHRTPVGESMARILSDAQVFGSGFNETTTELLDTWLFSISLIVTMIIYDPRLTLFAMLPVPLAFVLSYGARNWVRDRTTATRLAQAALTTALQERLSGVRVVRLFGRSAEAVGEIDRLSRNLERTNVREAQLQLGLQPIYSILVTSGVFVVVWYGGRQVITGALTAGSLVAFLQLYLRFVLRGHRLPLFFNRLQSANVAWERLERLLAPPPPLEDEPPWASFITGHIAGINEPVPTATAIEHGPMSVSLGNVAFRYPGGHALALEDVSLEIPAGGLWAVTGPVGSGKSALLRAILGLYPLEEGEIRLDGRPLAEMDETERALRIAYLPQDPGLFSGTILENLGAPAKESDSPALRRAVSLAALQPDLDGFPQGLLTQIGEGGIQISGGQRQRTALARALYQGAGRAPGLLLLDDPFASVDVETEGQIIAALRQAVGPGAPPEQRLTIVLCSHRLAAFAQADRVLVLERGRVVEQGTHETLLAQRGLYARIYRSQHALSGSPASEEVRR